MVSQGLLEAEAADEIDESIFLLTVPGPPPDIGGGPTVQAQPEREAITQLLCILGQDFTRAAAKRRVRIMRTNMTTLTQI